MRLFPKLPASPRLALRAVRALERIARATEDLRDATFHAHRIPSPTRSVADDTDDDNLVLYATDRDTWDTQQADERRRRDGFPVQDPVAPPRH